MKKIGIFYGSTTGTTKAVAEKLARMLDVAAEDIHNVADTAPSQVAPYDLMVMASSTWGGGELQGDWYDFVDGLQALDLRGKQIALLGCGDETMADTFCDAVGELHERLKDTGAEFVGEYDTAGYTFHHSKAIAPDGEAYGLLIDEVNHPELTDLRLRSWAGILLS